MILHALRFTLSFSMDRKPALTLTLGLVAAAGIWLLEISTPYGLGLIDDAISYIAAARAMLSGFGFTRIWLATGLEPITHWPPGYPAVLTAISFILKIDPYRSARALNILVFGGNAALLALLGYKMTRSTIWAAFLSLIFLLNSAILRLHAQALSEPLYLFVSMLAFWAFYEAIEGNDKKSHLLLVLTGFLTALSYITRYAALSLFATFVVAIFILYPTWRKRFVSFGIFLIGAIPPIFAWMLRNKLVGGSATNRAIRWHPVTTENIQRGLQEFFAFLVPLSRLRTTWYENFTFLGFFVAVLIIFLLTWLLPRGLKYFLKPKNATRPETISFTTVLYIFGYMGSLFVSLTLFDAATPLNDRIMSPVYVAVLVMLVYFIHKLFGQGKMMGKFLSFVLMLAVGVLFVSAQIRQVRALQETPTGFASWRWRESVVMETIRNLPEDVIVYTNQQPAVYFWTDRPAMVLPRGDTQISEVREKILKGEVVLAYFPPDDKVSPVEAKELWWSDLPTIQKSGLGNLYGVSQ